MRTKEENMREKKLEKAKDLKAVEKIKKIDVIDR